MINIAILLSGEGENAERIIQHFEQFADVRVNLVIMNKPEQPALLRLRRYNIQTEITDRYVEIDKFFTQNDIHYIILDNWSDKVPPNSVKSIKEELSISIIHYIQNIQVKPIKVKLLKQC
jgi:folate-dependent phosphoribosylglycinamide formyltransferase PurN